MTYLFLSLMLTLVICSLLISVSSALSHKPIADDYALEYLEGNNVLNYS